MASPKPAVQVFREFDTLPEGLVNPLRSCIIGPSYQLVRHGQAGEKANGLLGTYTGSSMESLWPSKEAGATVDLDYTKVFLDNAWLRYFSIAENSYAYSASAPNVLKIGNPAPITLATNAAGTRDASLKRDVLPGDRVRIGSGASQMDTYITALQADIVPSSFVPAVELDVAESEDTAAGDDTDDSTNNVILTFGVTTWDPRPYGATGGVFTFELVDIIDNDSSDATNLRFSVTSDFGGQEGEFTPAAYGQSKEYVEGLSVTLTIEDMEVPEVVIGDTWTFTGAVLHDAAEITVASGSTYTGPVDTTYVLTCIKGGDVVDGVILSVTSTSGVDSASPILIEGDGIYTVGSFGLSIEVDFDNGSDAGMVLGDTWTIAAVAQSEGEIKAVKLAHNLPSDIGTNYPVQLIMERDIEVDRYNQENPGTFNWEATADTITLSSNISGYVSEWSGGSEGLPVIQGSAYVEYRAVRSLPLEVGSITSTSDIPALLGTIDPDNPLAFATLKCWQNANGSEVRFVATRGESQDDFIQAIELIEAEEEVYSLVPLTRDQGIINLFVAHVNEFSSGERTRWRILWVSPAVDEVDLISDTNSAGDPLFATVAEFAGENVQVLATNGKFITDGVQPGDKLKIVEAANAWGEDVFKEYVIDSVITESELRLVFGPANPIVVASRAMVNRTLTPSALAQKYVQIAGGHSSERVYAPLFDRGPDRAMVGGVEVSGLFVASAFAGLRSASAPHQPLSNVELQGFDGTNPNPLMFSEANFNTLRDGGIWVVRLDKSGKMYSERQLSTSTIDLNRKEQSITTNLDSISYYIVSILREFVGKTNITPSNIARAKLTLHGGLEFLASNATTDSLGPQLISSEILKFEQHPTMRDHIIADVGVDGPVPFNRAIITLIA